ncbi:MAG TPA: hypothetical protein VMM93_00975, partial [Vicinamibacterales bacterium]|nr:hypothetical protein [Vicinamibacterales bacterium]
MMTRALVFAVAIGAGSGCAAPAAGDRDGADSASRDRVVVERLPPGGIGPQAAAGPDGTVHVVYFAGDAMAGDVFYLRRQAEGAYTTPVRVNSQPGSAIVAGTIRGPQLAVGPGGAVHVVWNGSNRARPRPRAFMPVLYARSNEAGDRFGEQRNLAVTANGADGGSTVAAAPDGRVYVAWHTGDEGVSDARRGVYLVRSTDEGRTFGDEARVSPGALGACACCSMRAFVDRQGAVHLLYRAAADDINRDTVLLTSTDRGATFAAVRL